MFRKPWRLMLRAFEGLLVVTVVLKNFRRLPVMLDQRLNVRLKWVQCQWVKLLPGSPPPQRYEPQRWPPQRSAQQNLCLPLRSCSCNFSSDLRRLRTTNSLNLQEFARDATASANFSLLIGIATGARRKGVTGSEAIPDSVACSCRKEQVFEARPCYDKRLWRNMLQPWKLSEILGPVCLKFIHN